jgi:hypothetical protein
MPERALQPISRLDRGPGGLYQRFHGFFLLSHPVGQPVWIDGCAYDHGLHNSGRGSVGSG